MPTTRSLLMFDYDGVVADSLQYFLDAFLQACREHGHTQIHDREGFLRMFDGNMYDGMRAAGMPVEEHDPVLVTMSRLLRARAASYSVFPGMPEVLATLAREHVLYVVTSNVGDVVRADLARFGIEAFADVLGSEAGRSKVGKIRALSARHPGLPAFYIGDTVGDIREGREAGVTTVAVCWGWHGRERLAPAGPHHTADSPEQLVQVISGAPCDPARARPPVQAGQGQRQPPP